MVAWTEGAADAVAAGDADAPAALLRLLLKKRWLKIWDVAQQWAGMTQRAI